MGLWLEIFRVCCLELDLDRLLDLHLVLMKVLS